MDAEKIAAAIKANEIADLVEQEAIKNWEQHPRGRGYYAPEWSEISERQRDAMRVEALRDMRTVRAIINGD